MTTGLGGTRRSKRAAVRDGRKPKYDYAVWLAKYCLVWKAGRGLFMQEAVYKELRFWCGNVILIHYIHAEYLFRHGYAFELVAKTCTQEQLHCLYKTTFAFPGLFREHRTCTAKEYSSCIVGVLAGNSTI